MPGNFQCHVIIAAGGAGLRMGGGLPKQFRRVKGKPIFIRTVEAFDGCAVVDGITIVAPEEYHGLCRELLGECGYGHITNIVHGGADRGASVYGALRGLPEDVRLVLVHDAVRPFVTAEQITDVALAAAESGAAVLCVPMKDTVKVVGDDGAIDSTPDRNTLMLAQTPQGFDRALLQRAYERAAADGFAGTDDASYVERLGVRPRIVLGDYGNIKITTEDDLRFFGADDGERRM